MKLVFINTGNGINCFYSFRKVIQFFLKLALFIKLAKICICQK